MLNCMSCQFAKCPFTQPFTRNPVLRSACAAASSWRTLKTGRANFAAKRNTSSEVLVSRASEVDDSKPSGVGWSADRYRMYPFTKEDLRSVIREVPDVDYYAVGDPDPQPYPYKDIPLDEPIDYQNEVPVNLVTPKRELELSQLENGLKIATIDLGGFAANIGLFVHTGSRFEEPDTFGCSKFIEHMAYQATAHLSWLRTIKTIESIGATAGCTAGREHILYHAELERKYIPILIPLMTGNVVFPRFISWEVTKKSKDFDEDRDYRFNNNVDAKITEMLHSVAWHSNTLGHRLFPHDRDQKNYDPEKMREFMMRHCSPDRMIMVGINVNHEEMCKWTMRAFVDYEAIPHRHREEPKAKYTGGVARMDANCPVTHYAVAYETPDGWNSVDLVPLTVLQTILGGGGSFSTGGPGKGMYTRLYMQVLSTHWVESCVAFNTQYSDSGLFGLYITGPPVHAQQMIRLLNDQFGKMSTVTAEELQRAKNALKSSIWMNLENRAVLLEDIGRQLLMSGKVMSGAELCKQIDEVTPGDIERAVHRIMKTEPTVIIHGDVAKFPPTLELMNQLKQHA